MDENQVASIIEANHSELNEEERSSLNELLESASSAEKGGLLTTARRGGTVKNVKTWLENARKDAEKVGQDAYDYALALYSDSNLLAWNECLAIAPAVSYRSPLLDKIHS